MMNLPWWVIVIGIVVVFLIYRIIKGLWAARSCRKEFIKEEKTTETEIDEDFESGDSDSN